MHVVLALNVRPSTINCSALVHVVPVGIHSQVVEEITSDALVNVQVDIRVKMDSVSRPAAQTLTANVEKLAHHLDFVCHNVALLTTVRMALNVLMAFAQLAACPTQIVH